MALERTLVSVHIYVNNCHLDIYVLIVFYMCLGTFNLHVRVEYLFFIGSQLVALSPSGKLGVWHAMTQHWQTQDVVPIASFDTAGSFLLLGCNNGCIYYIGNVNIDINYFVFHITLILLKALRVAYARFTARLQIEI